jgi:hypothetical protein
MPLWNCEGKQRIIAQLAVPLDRVTWTLSVLPNDEEELRMPTCYRCGDWISFMTQDGMAIPIHESGSCSGYSGSSARLSASLSDYRGEDLCWCTTCPRCGEPVYFVRHNGGSVWFDELGWPWEKHACFDDQPISRGIPDLRPLAKRYGNTALAGCVIEELPIPRGRARSIFSENSLNTLLVIACFDNHGRCVEITGKVRGLRNELVFFEVTGSPSTLSTVDGRSWRIRQQLDPVELGFTSQWVEAALTARGAIFHQKIKSYWVGSRW